MKRIEGCKMKFIKKIPPEDEKRSEELAQHGYRKLKEPKSVGAAIAISLPLSMVLMVLAGFWCYFLNPSFFDFMSEEGMSIVLTFNLSSILYLAGMVLCLLVHELIHAIFIPKVWRSEKTYWGFNGLFGFVYTEEELTKERFLLVSIMPLILISFVFPVILNALGIWSHYLIFLSVFNAGGACVDLLNMVLVTAQVPFRGYVVSNGYSSFYKKAS